MNPGSTIQEDARRGALAYQRKTHFVKLVPQLRRIREETNRNQAVAVVQIGLFQDRMRALFDELGVWADRRHQYQAYAAALDKSQRVLRYMVDWIREHRILRDRFERRGLRADFLDAIDTQVIYRTKDV
ncbi:unnamed protein product [marine sediment metagenome]|uniref:Uncharacterized protein n=1 Tax=marine sediment metagenome TaxID=412755 RepID=X1SNK6_9ZZZZ